MMLLRRAWPNDLHAIHNLAIQSGVGLTTLPKDLDVLKRRLELACQSFDKQVDSPTHEYYLFVLEDTVQKQITGVSAVEAATGYDAPFYSYKVSKRSRFCPSLNIRQDHEFLTLVNDYQHVSAMCTLYLHPEWRKNHNGVFLSRGRFLFMANFPHRFSSTVIAEMRGISDENGLSPFWEGVGRHFFKIPFAEADHLSITTDKQFITDLIVDTPIPVPLLNPKAQEAIGKPHASTLSAMKILQNEGFENRGYIDIFDGGPTLDIPLKNIRTLASSRILTVDSLSDNVSHSPCLIAGTAPEFRAVVDSVMIHDDRCILSKEAAAQLQVQCGDSIRIAALRPETV